MIATLIFLDMTFAVRALLGVGEDPDCVFTLCTLFFNPELCPGAIARVMLIVSALEAEFGATIALNDLQKARFLQPLRS